MRNIGSVGEIIVRRADHFDMKVTVGGLDYQILGGRFLGRDRQRIWRRLRRIGHRQAPSDVLDIELEHNVEEVV